MIAAIVLYVLVAVGGVATLMWMLEQRIYATAAVSGASWALIAYTGAEIQTYTLDGTAVTHDGWAVQTVAVFLAGVSFLAIVATYFGHYPPEPEDLK